MNFVRQGRCFEEVELADFRRQVAGQTLNRERLDGAHRPAALDEGRPDLVGRVTQGGDETKTGYDHTPLVTKHE